MIRAETKPSAAEQAAGWLVVAAGDRDSSAVETPVRARGVLVRVAASTILVLLLVLVAGALASHRLAEKESVNDAAHNTDLLAETVVQPSLDDGLVHGQESSRAQLDALVRDRALRSSIIRVKIWTAEGRIVYSDEPRLIDQTYRLAEDDLDVFAHPRTVAEVTDLSRPENRYERGFGKMLEVYRPISTPSGHTLLFETYARYDVVTQRSGQIWRGMVGITVASLLLLVVLLVPILLALTRRVVSHQRHRERLLRQVVDASDQERRRISASLHDGAVQDLAATTFALAAAGQSARTAGDPHGASALQSAAAEVRTNIQQLRSLLVDIYPESLTNAGLNAALRDLAATVHGRGFAVSVTTPVELDGQLSPGQEQLVFRVAQECLRNAAKHAQADNVDLIIADASDEVILDVIDDGLGFDPKSVLDAPEEGHFGLRLLADMVSHQAAILSVASIPGHGTHWRLRVPKTVVEKRWSRRHARRDETARTS